MDPKHMENRPWANQEMMFGEAKWLPSYQMPREGRFLLYRQGRAFCGCFSHTEKMKVYCWIDGRSNNQLIDLYSYWPVELMLAAPTTIKEYLQLIPPNQGDNSHRRYK